MCMCTHVRGGILPESKSLPTFTIIYKKKKSREKDKVLLVKMKKVIIHSARVPQTTK